MSNIVSVDSNKLKQLLLIAKNLPEIKTLSDDLQQLVAYNVASIESDLKATIPNLFDDIINSAIDKVAPPVVNKVIESAVDPIINKEIGVAESAAQKFLESKL